MELNARTKLAIDRNLIVFDCDANPGELSGRLLLLMNDVMCLNYSDSITNDVNVHGWVDRKITDLWVNIVDLDYILYYFCKQMGITVRALSSQDYQTWRAFLKSETITPVSRGDDKHLLLAACLSYEKESGNQRDYLLGSY